MAARASSPGPDGALSEARFEVLVAELDAIVARLERGEVALDEALEAFERGMTLARAAGGLLDHAEARLAILSEDARTRGTRETPMAFPTRDAGESSGSPASGSEADPRRAFASESAGSPASGSEADPRRAFASESE